VEEGEEEEVHSSAGLSDRQIGGGGGGLHTMGQAAGLRMAGVAALVSAGAGAACGCSGEIHLLRRCSDDWTCHAATTSHYISRSVDGLVGLTWRLGGNIAPSLSYDDA